MRISLKHQFVFLSYPKTACTSVGVFLDEYADIFPVKATLTNEEQPFYKHMSAKKMKIVFEKNAWKWDEFYRFCVVRNPFDRMVSAYHYRKELMTRPVTTRGKIFNLVWWLRNKLGPELTFEKFLRNYNPRKISYVPLLDFIADDSKNILVDRIIRFENLRAELERVIIDMGIDSSPDMSKLPNLNTTRSREHYRNYYNTRTRKFIENHYAFELKQFDYHY